MNKVRLTFSKEGIGVYISHLDLLRLFTRALRRSGLKVAYSGGFHPHMQMVFSMPLSLGTASRCEFLEISFETAPELKMLPDLLNQFLPACVRVLRAEWPKSPLSTVFSSEYELHLTGNFASDAFADVIRSWLNGGPILIEKKTKRTCCETDIRPMILRYSVEPEQNTTVLTVQVVSNNEQNLNPNVLVRAIEKYLPEYPLQAVSITKTQVYFRTDSKGE